MHKAASEEAGCEDAAPDIEEETEGIKDEDSGSPLLGACQQEQHDQKRERCSDLGTVADPESSCVQSRRVEKVHVVVDNRSIWSVHRYDLALRVECCRIERRRRRYWSCL